MKNLYNTIRKNDSLYLIRRVIPEHMFTFNKKLELDAALQSLPANLKHTLGNVDWVRASYEALGKESRDEPKNGLNKYEGDF